jgi:hypothetical protein
MRLINRLSRSQRRTNLGNQPWQQYKDFGRRVYLGLLTHTRAGIASYTDADLRIADAAAGVLRSGHYVLDPVTGVYVPSVLLEGQAQNLLTHSATQTAASWTKRGAVAVAVSPVAAPKAGATAYRISGIVDSSSGDMFQATLTGTLASGAPFAPGLWVRRVSTSGVLVLSNTASALYGLMSVNLATLPDEWVRLTPTHPAVTVTNPFVASPTGTAGVLFRATDGPVTIDLWNVQITDGAVVTSDIVTTDAVASRVADLAYYTGTGDSPLTRPQASWWYIQFIEGGTTLLQNGRVWQMSSAGAYLICYYASGSYRVSLSDGAASAFTPPLGAAPVLGDRVELLALIYPNGLLRLVQSINGTPVASQEIAGPTLPPVWGNNRAYINSGSTGFHGVNSFLPNARGELITVSRASASFLAMTPQQQMDYARTRYQYEAA